VDDKLPSYAIALTPAGGNVAALDERLRKSPVPIVGRREGDRLLLDLRTVLPRQDQSLVEMVVRRATPVAENAIETAAPANV
jgi:L-seryl-tRNA(Ser) seleniumtransferase